MVNEFSKLCDQDEGKVLTDHLYKSLTEVVQYGYNKMQKQVTSDFNKYADKKKRELKTQQKTPRKIIRDFVKACNTAQLEPITKNLAQDISFGKIGSMEEKYWTKGIKEFEVYLTSPHQELCSKDYEIRSINFFPKNISVRLRYLHQAADEDANSTPWRKYKRLQFELKNDKIISIRLEDWY